MSHFPLKHFARWFVLCRIADKPRTACRPQTACGRHCPWEPTALHETGATTTVAPAAFSGFIRPLYRKPCHHKLQPGNSQKALFFGTKRRFPQQNVINLAIAICPDRSLSVHAVSTRKAFMQADDQ